MSPISSVPALAALALAGGVVLAFRIPKFRHWWFSVLWAAIGADIGKMLRPRKRELLEEHVKAGDVLVDVGAGYGASIADYTLPDKPLAKLVLLEPNQNMVPALRRVAEAQGYTGARLELYTTPLEASPVRDGSADVVLLSLVLCSVPDPELAIRHALRMLRPGGKVLFLEHVAAAKQGEWRYLVQRALTKSGFWPAIGDGCCLDRETGRMIESCTGWKRVALKEFDNTKGLWLVRDHIYGYGVKA